MGWIWRDKKGELSFLAAVAVLGACGSGQPGAAQTSYVTQTVPGPTVTASFPVPGPTVTTTVERTVTAAASAAAPGQSIAEGTWTVGEDIQPGTYKTASAVSGQCYWSITKTGSNGGDIIENDIVTGGRPQVTLKAGQDFTTRRCGNWAKQ